MDKVQKTDPGDWKYVLIISFSTQENLNKIFNFIQSMPLFYLMWQQSFNTRWWGYILISVGSTEFIDQMRMFLTMQGVWTPITDRHSLPTIGNKHMTLSTNKFMYAHHTETYIIL
jgi:hypothetical protein